MYNSSKHKEQEVLAPTYCDRTHVLPPSYSEPRETHIRHLEFQKKFHYIVKYFNHKLRTS